MNTLTTIEIPLSLPRTREGVRVARLAITKFDSHGQQQVLLARNIKKNELELTGGALNPGECWAVGAAREANEEVNAVTVITSGFVKYLSYPMIGGIYDGLPYEARVARAEHVGGVIYPKSEVTETMWVSTQTIHRLPELRSDVLPALGAVGVI